MKQTMVTRAERVENCFRGLLRLEEVAPEETEILRDLAWLLMSEAMRLEALDFARAIEQFAERLRKRHKNATRRP